MDVVAADAKINPWAEDLDGLERNGDGKNDAVYGREVYGVADKNE